MKERKKKRKEKKRRESGYPKTENVDRNKEPKKDQLILVFKCMKSITHEK